MKWSMDMGKCTVCGQQAYKQKTAWIFEGERWLIKGKQYNFKGMKLHGGANIGLCVDCIAKQSENIMRKAIRKSWIQAIGIVLAGILAAVLLNLYLFNSDSHENANYTLPFLLGFGVIIASIAISTMVFKPWFRRRAYKRGKISPAVYVGECIENLTDDYDVGYIFENTPLEAVCLSDSIIFNWDILKNRQSVSANDFNNPAFLAEIRKPIECGRDYKIFIPSFRLDKPGELPASVRLMMGISESPNNQQKLLLVLQNYFRNQANR